MIESVDRENPRTGTCTECKRNIVAYTVYPVKMTTGEWIWLCSECLVNAVDSAA